MRTVKVGLKRLMAARVDQHASVIEVFPYGPFKDIFGDRDPKDDRSDAILAVAVMEQALEHALTSVFMRDETETREKMFDSDTAIIRDLYSKMTMAYMLGIIGKATFRDINLIRHIRNVFSHSRAIVNFDTSEIVLACLKISLFERMGEVSERSVNADPRKFFFNSAFEFSLWLFTYDIQKDDFWGRQILQS